MNAYLLLANGMVFAGRSVGAAGVTVGEVVFATGMVGFEETLTDPSYYGQIITQTYPLIGNYGMNRWDMESQRVWARGYIVREACTTPSNWRSEETLDSFLKRNGIIGIEGIDTRRLTRIIRESGVMNGAILTEFDPADPANAGRTQALLDEVRAYAVTDAVKNVTCTQPQVHNPQGSPHIVLMDYGCKRNIVRCLVRRGCKVTVMPAFSTAEEVAALAPDGIMLSNGPGDPAEPVQAIENLRRIFELNIPTFGICLGHQLSALAAGAKTTKLKYGHRAPTSRSPTLPAGAPSSPARTTAMRWWGTSCPPRWARWPRSTPTTAPARASSTRNGIASPSSSTRKRTAAPRTPSFCSTAS